MSAQLTVEQLDIIGHSLGINTYHSKRSKKKKDKILPSDFYRNRFCTGPGSNYFITIQGLVEQGLMKQGKTVVTTDHYFYVTDEGIDLFRKEFKDYVNNQID